MGVGAHGTWVAPQVLGSGLHSLVKKVLNRGARVVIGGLPGHVRAAVDILAADEETNDPLHKVSVDLWTPAPGGEQREERWQRKILTFICKNPMRWQACFPTPWWGGGG